MKIKVIDEDKIQELEAGKLSDEVNIDAVVVVGTIKETKKNPAYAMSKDTQNILENGLDLIQKETDSFSDALEPKEVADKMNEWMQDKEKTVDKAIAELAKQIGDNLNQLKKSIIETLKDTLRHVKNQADKEQQAKEKQNDKPDTKN